MKAAHALILSALSLIWLWPGAARAADEPLELSSLYIASGPAGATVFIDGQYAGVTPIELPKAARDRNCRQES